MIELEQTAKQLAQLRHAQRVAAEIAARQGPMVMVYSMKDEVEAGKADKRAKKLAKKMARRAA